MKLEVIQPRSLRYRSHYKMYVLGFLILSLLLSTFWSMKLLGDGWKVTFQDYSYELLATGLYFTFSGIFYFSWLQNKLKKSIQVYQDHILINNGRKSEVIKFDEIESLKIVCYSIFYVKLKSGIKHYFNQSIERIDYIWEGLYRARPDLLDEKAYEVFRLKLVQYDHHQKRKEWFFKHRLVDFCHWVVLPLVFLAFGFVIQSKDIEIHQQSLYFFRLLMYSMLVLITTTFIYSISLKKLIFDKKLSGQMEDRQDKTRDLEFEGIILQRSKIFQIGTAGMILAMVIKLDVNLYSISKVREDISSFNLKKGATILIDNRYNCLSCKYNLNDGDFVVFGKGIIGQVLAKEGDMVGQIAQDVQGRMIASENVQEVPKGHVAVKAANGKDIVFIKIEELIGKIQK